MSNLLPKERSELACYSANQIDYIWPTAAPIIQRALDRGSNYSINDIHIGLLSGGMQLWMYGHESALVTAIQTKGDKTFCLLLSLAGKDMSQWFEYFPIVETWAKEQGAEEMRLYGRIGWAKLTGYDVEWTKMSKQL